MGFFKNLLIGKPTFTSAIKETQARLFAIHGVVVPTDAQNVRTLVYLSITGTAILNDLGGGQLRKPIDDLVASAAGLAAPFAVRIQDLAGSSAETLQILSKFPKDLRITASTGLGGTTAFDTLYDLISVSLYKTLFMQRNNLPFGIPGYAAIMISDDIFGTDGSQSNVLPVTTELIHYLSKLADSAALKIK